MQLWYWHWGDVFHFDGALGDLDLGSGILDGQAEGASSLTANVHLASRLAEVKASWVPFRNLGCFPGSRPATRRGQGSLRAAEALRAGIL